MAPLDLHVLGLPLAFILSQDQTLHGNQSFSLPPSLLMYFNVPSLFSPFQIGGANIHTISPFLQIFFPLFITFFNK